jgi:hypothetical protein
VNFFGLDNMVGLAAWMLLAPVYSRIADLCQSIRYAAFLAE